MQGSAGQRSENRVQEVSEITRGLKAIASVEDDFHGQLRGLVAALVGEETRSNGNGTEASV